MKKKYIIALEDRNVWSCGLPAKTLLLSDVSIFGTDLASVNTGIELTPYTEPDLERVRKEAYDKGMGDAEMLAYKLYSPKIDEAYQHGLNDAWDAARTLWNTPNRKEIFGHTTFNTVLTTLTAQEAIEKIRQYEQEKEEIKVGDEVAYKHDKNLKGFVYQVDRHVVRGVTSGAVNFQWIKDTVVKTGRHFPQIAEVLQKMKE